MTRIREPIKLPKEEAKIYAEKLARKKREKREKRMKLLPSGFAQTVDSHKLRTYRKYEKYLIEYYKTHRKRDKVPILQRNRVLYILRSRFLDDNITSRLVTSFLMNKFEKLGKNSYGVPQGHILNPVV